MTSILGNRKCIAIVSVVVAAIVTASLMIEPVPNRFTGITPGWYDVAIIILFALVPALLMTSMTVDTDDWSPAVIGLLIFFGGISLLFFRVLADTFGSSHLQSVEVLWTIRTLLSIGLLLMLIEGIHRVVVRPRDWRRGVKRLFILALAICVAVGLVILVQTFG